MARYFFTDRLWIDNPTPEMDSGGGRIAIISNSKKALQHLASILPQAGVSARWEVESWDGDEPAWMLAGYRRTYNMSKMPTSIENQLRARLLCRGFAFGVFAHTLFIETGEPRLEKRTPTASRRLG